jgi:hypothetical protein
VSCCNVRTLKTLKLKAVYFLLDMKLPLVSVRIRKNLCWCMMILMILVTGFHLLAINRLSINLKKLFLMWSTCKMFRRARDVWTIFVNKLKYSSESFIATNTEMPTKTFILKRLDVSLYIVQPSNTTSNIYLIIN